MSHHVWSGPQRYKRSDSASFPWYTLAARQVTDVALHCTGMKAGHGQQLYQIQVQINKAVKYVCHLQAYNIGPDVISQFCLKQTRNGTNWSSAVACGGILLYASLFHCSWSQFTWDCHRNSAPVQISTYFHSLRPTTPVKIDSKEQLLCCSQIMTLWKHKAKSRYASQEGQLEL